jgi:hypothetical protein
LPQHRLDSAHTAFLFMDSLVDLVNRVRIGSRMPWSSGILESPQQCCQEPRWPACWCQRPCSLKLLNDCGVIVDEPGLEGVPLPRGDAGVKRRQLPQRHNLVAHACARVLASLRVAVHIVLALSRLLEGNLSLEPPDHDLRCLEALQGHCLQQGL